MIDWNDNTKRKAFREALQEAYPNPDDLDMFVDEELNENLAAVAGGSTLQVTSYSLVKWARAKGRLDDVFAAFKQENPNHLVIAILERQDTVTCQSNLSSDDWDELFARFIPDDLADLCRAFKRGFKEVLKIEFRRVRPKHTAFMDLLQIREALEHYDAGPDGPIFAVRFAEHAIAELQRSDDHGNRDLSALQTWCDRIAAQFNVPPASLPAEPAPTRHAYLLVTLEEHGSDVNVYPELRVTGSDKPIGFGARPATCSVDKVTEQISAWIEQAEAVMEADNYDDDEVTLELFLSWTLLDTNIIDTWRVQDKWGKEIPLDIHRRFLIRSSDRIRNRKIQSALQRRWQILETCVQSNTACAQFHLQTTCLPEGRLLALLKGGNAPGLKFVAQLPSEPEKRASLLQEMIDAAIPIALWSSGEVSDSNKLAAEFDALLRESHLTNFAALANQWRNRRSDQATAESTKPIRLLCDRPDRRPQLPDPDQDEDLLVSA